MTSPTITYTWRIEQLDCVPTEGGLHNVVQQIHWRLFGTDGTNTLDLFGVVPLGDADPEDFTLYTELTQPTVISWLEAAIDAQTDEDNLTVAQLRANLAGMLAAIRTPPVVTPPLPW